VNERLKCEQDPTTLKKYVVNMIVKSKFGISKYSQVFNGVGTSYSGLTEFIIIDQCISFLEKEITLVLLILSFMKFAVHQPCTESMSDYSRLQLVGDLMTQIILISSAKRRYVE
jgi:hypothetical protein